MQLLHYFSKFGRAGNWLLFANLMTGATFAFIIPVMSYFFLDQKGDGLNAKPVDFLIYLIAITFFGTICNQVMGRLADKGFGSKWIYIFSMACSGIATLLYANIDSVLLIFVVGIVFVGLGSAAVPQLLTVSRQYAQHANLNVNQFNSVLRASFAAGWVVGASFAYKLIEFAGFKGAFYAATFVSALAIVVALFALPNYHKSKEHRTTGKPDHIPLGFWLLMIVMIIGNIANSLYMLSIPLIITNELNLSGALPGNLFAIVALLEIPFMLYSAKLATRFNRYHLVMISFLMGLIFYVGIYFATQSWQFMALQIFNAAFIGIYAGLGISIVQDQLPKYVGFTSAMYTNSLRIGSTLGAVGLYVVGEYFTYHTAVLGALSCMVICLIGLIILQASPTQKSV